MVWRRQGFCVRITSAPNTNRPNLKTTMMHKFGLDGNILATPACFIAEFKRDYINQGESQLKAISRMQTTSRFSAGRRLKHLRC